MSSSEASASLQAYARCLALLADEIEAMRVGDTVRLHELARQRAEAERELGEIAADSSPYAGLGAMAEEAVRELEDMSETDRQLEKDVSRLEAESLPLLRGIKRWLSPGNYRELAADQTRFDVLL